MPSSPPGFELTCIWTRTLAPQHNDPHEEMRKRLRNSFLSFRRNVIPIAENTHSSIKHLTVHDISHIDRLWQIADQLTGEKFPISPLEAFLMGGAFLLHDLGLALAAYPKGVEELRREAFWRDSAARILRKRLYRAVRLDELDNPSPDVVQQATEETLRQLHAEKAGQLGVQRFAAALGGSDYLIDDLEIRDHYGELIGRIARSHWDNLDQVADEFSGPLGAMPGCPSDWTVDRLKIACLLRVCDACHLDAGRAPALLRALRKPSGIAELHWKFQGFVQALVVKHGQAYFTSSKPFRLDDREAWWLGFDLLRQADRELNEVNALLRETDRPAFLADSVAGIQSPRRLSQYLRTEGWTPVDTRLRVSDVAKIVYTLGGEGLYGRNPTIVLRELIQNARDAVVARRVLEAKDASWGAIHVRLFFSDDSFWLEVQDDGLGMSQHVLSGPLLDFGESYWDSDLAIREWPGLTASDFEPTGKYGIGFFSVFMAADEVKVVTRRQEDRKSETRVLEFTEGLRVPPVLRQAASDEQMSDPGTFVRLRLRNKPSKRGGILGPMHFEPVVTEIVKRRTAWTLRDLCEWLCPALDVDLFAAEGAESEMALRANDWLTIEPERLLRRLMLHAEESKEPLVRPLPNSLLGNFRTLRDDAGQAIGRGCVWPIMARPELTGHITAGRFRGRVGREIAGLFLGRAAGSTRYDAIPLATGDSPETLKWASEQAHLLKNCPLDIPSASHAASVIRSIGADTGPLPIAIGRKGLVSFEAIREMSRLPQTVILVPGEPFAEAWWASFESEVGRWDDNRLIESVLVVLSPRQRAGLFPGSGSDPLKRGQHPAWRCFWMSLWGAAMEAVALAWDVDLDKMLSVSRIATRERKFSAVIGLDSKGEQISRPDVDILCKP